MSSVDDRIVNMQFNNKQFTKGAADADKSLQNLESTITKVGKSQGMAQLDKSVQATTHKFSIMQIAGVTAVANIANKAVNAGIKFAKSFTVDPIRDGWNEYNTTLKSVQTIMSNTGKTVDVVNKYLDDMNHFSDKTIYNFGEMAKNLGTFTAAGVDLKTAKASIQGIANVAALSGSSSQQASTAMYQLSQALAAGKVGAQDWNSVVNAGMGGKKLQTIIAQTAVAMGKLNKAQVTGLKDGEALKISNESFRNSIMAKPGSKIWFDSDVLKNSLAIMDGGLSRYSMRMDGIDDKEKQRNMLMKKREELAKKGLKFGDAEWKQMVKTSNAAFKAATQVKTIGDLVGTVRESVGSLWAQGFRTIVGDFEQSKEMWTEANAVIGGQLSKIGLALFATKKDVQKGAVDARGLLTIWATKGGRTDAIEGIKNALIAFGSVLGTIKSAFLDVFGSDTKEGGKTLLALSKGFRDFTENLKPSKQTLEDLRNIFGGVFSVLHIGVSVITAIASAFGSFFGELFKSSDKGRGGILSFLGSIGQAITKFDEFITSGNVLQDVFKGIGSGVGKAIGPIVKMVGYLAEAIAALVSGKGIDAAFAPLGKIKGAFGELVSVVAGAAASITAPWESVSNWFDKIKSKADGLTASVSGITSVFDKIGGGSGKAESGTSKVLDTMKSSSESLVGVFDKVKASTDSATSSMTPMQKVMEKTDFAVRTSDGAFVKLSDTLGSTVGAAFDSSANGANQFSGELQKSTSEAQGSLSAWQIFKTILVGTFDAVGGAISKVFGWISNLFNGFDAQDWANLLNSALFAMLLKSLNDISGGFKGLVEFLPEANKTFSIFMKDVAQSISDFTSQIAKAALLRAIAISIGILVAAIIALTFVKYEKLAVSIGAIGILIAMLVKSLGALGDNKNLGKEALAIGTAMTSLATSVGILAGAVFLLSRIKTQKLYSTIGALGIIMGALVGAFIAISKWGAAAIEGAAAMGIMARAILVLTAAIGIMALIPVDKLWIGIGAIAALVAILTASMVALSSFGKFAVTGSAAMIAMAIAVTILSGALLMMAAIPAGKLWKGVGIIAAVVTILTVALMALGSVGPMVAVASLGLIGFAIAIGMMIPVMVALAAIPWSVIIKSLIAIALMAIPLTLLGVAALIAAPGFVALGAAMLMAGVGMALFGTGLTLAVAAGSAGIAIMSAAVLAFVALLPTIAQQLALAVASFFETLATMSESLRDSFGRIFSAILGVIDDNVPKIMKTLRKLLTAGIKNGLQAIRDLAPDFFDTLTFLINEMLRSIDENIDGFIDKGVDIIEKIIKGIGEGMVDITDTMFQVVTDTINGLAAVVRERSGELRDAGVNLMGAILSGLTFGLSDKLAAIAGTLTRKLKEKLPGPLKKLVGGGSSGGDSGGSSGRVIAEPVTPPSASSTTGWDSTGLTPRMAAAAATAVTSVVGDVTSKVISKPLARATGSLADNVGELNKTLAAKPLSLDFSKVTDALNSFIQFFAVGNWNLQSAMINRNNTQSEADNLNRQADVLESQAENKKAKKKKKLTNQANKLRAKAEAAQARADAAQSEVDFQESVRNATNDRDLSGALSDRAQEVSEIARQKQAEAEANLQAAKKLRKLGGQANKARAKKLEDAAIGLTETANKLASDALTYTSQSLEALKRDLNASLDAVIADRDKVIKDREEQRKYEEADDAGKIAILKDRNNNETTGLKKQLADEQKIYDDAVTAARNYANAGNAALAEQQTQLASQAAAKLNDIQNQIDQNDKTIKDLENGGTSGSGGSGVLMPSKSVLDNAARVVDSFTQSQMDAMSAVASAPTTIQFNQTNTSPVALSQTEIYRQSKNLVSAAINKLT